MIFVNFNHVWLKVHFIKKKLWGRGNLARWKQLCKIFYCNTSHWITKKCLTHTDITLVLIRLCPQNFPTVYISLLFFLFRWINGRLAYPLLSLVSIISVNVIYKQSLNCVFSIEFCLRVVGSSWMSFCYISVYCHSVKRL